MEGNAYEQFDSTRSVVPFDDGRMAVAAGGSRLMRVSDPRGGFLVAVGGSGDGPGGFREVAVITGLAFDTLYVYDGTLRRVTVLNPQGRFQRSIPIGVPDTIFAPTVDGFFSDGSVLMSSRPGFWMIGEISELRADTVRYCHHVVGGASTREVARIPARETWFHGTSHTRCVSSGPTATFAGP